LVEALRDKNRIIAEAILSERYLGDEAADCAAKTGYHIASFSEREHTAKASSA